MTIDGAYTIVTGASSGLGAAAARALAAKGAHALLLARSKDKLIKIEKEIIMAGGKANAFAVDLSKPPETARVCKKILKEFGAPDIIINNAGFGEWRSIENTTPAENVEMMSVPYFAAFNVTHAFIAGMLERNSGHIVNITSPASEFPIAGAVSYSVARWAMRGFNEALWADLYDTKIGVSLYSPGKISSEYFQNNPGSEEKIPALSKLARTITPEEGARNIIKCIEKNKRMLVTPFMMKFFYVNRRYFRGLTDYLVMKTAWRRQRK